MTLQEIQRKLGCSLTIAMEVQKMLIDEQTLAQTARILCSSALSELNDAMACGNVSHPKIEAAAEYLRSALDL
jgi:hypothetical protein